jgi:hypothetical protein
VLQNVSLNSPSLDGPPNLTPFLTYVGIMTMTGLCVVRIYVSLVDRGG